MHGSRYAAALTVFARCHYDRRRHKRAWSVDRPASRNERPPAVTNVLPPKGVAGAGGTTMMRRNRRNREPTVGRRPSYHRRPIGPRRHTARLFSLPLSRARQINTGECRQGRSTRSRSCVSASLPRFADRINRRGKCTRKWMDRFTIDPRFCNSSKEQRRIISRFIIAIEGLLSFHRFSTMVFCNVQMNIKFAILFK